MSRGLGPVQQKILLLLLGGISLGLSGSPRRYFKILDAIVKDWKEIDAVQLRRSIRALYASQLILEKHNSDGTVSMVLSKQGKKLALRYDIDRIHIPQMHQWDKKWRLVIFDVPERIKEARNTLRYHLKELGFHELQRSVFVHPYDCEKEIEFLIEFYNLRRFVRLIVAYSIDNELHLKEKFGLG